MAKKAYKEVYVADFETSHENRNGIDNAWVWSAGWSRINTEKVNIVGNIKDFMTALLCNETKKVYFHNLKFDGQFILSWLLRKGYKQKDKATKKGEFSTIYTEMHNIYSITIPFVNNKGQNRNLMFLDSYKLYPYSLSVLAKQLNLPVSKGDIDHTICRRRNHSMTPIEIDYLERDVIILRKAVERLFEKGLVKITIGSNALAEYKELIGGQKSFLKVFPQLDMTIDRYLRNSYKGGCCMLMKEHESKIENNWTYDVNSMYPAILATELLPYGHPKYVTGKCEIDPLKQVYVQHIRVMFKLKPKHLPCIQIKNNSSFGKTTWLEDSDNEIVDLWLTNVDIDMFLKHYDTNRVEYVDGYVFNAMSGLFTKYIRKWYEIKRTTKDAGEKLFSKLFLNNIYGKFGTNPLRRSTMLKLKAQVVARDYLVESETDTVYLPVAIFNTSYARHKLLTSAQANYDNFVYCDTDSIHLTAPAKDIEIDGSKLGAWKLETENTPIKHLKQKTYILLENGEYKVTCAGLNKALLNKQGFELNFDTFKIGAKFKKFKAKKCVGGVYLSMQDHIIS